MARKVRTYISPSLYNEIKKEKLKLERKHKSKSRRRKIKFTLIDASNSLARKLK